jgi:preprotein translocase subunit SecE
MAEKIEKKSGFFAGVKRFFGKIVKFFRDTKSEMKKVVWPSKKQVLNNTIVVLVVVLVSFVVIFALDSLFGLSIQGLLGIATNQ